MLSEGGAANQMIVSVTSVRGFSTTPLQCNFYNACGRRFHRASGEQRHGFNDVAQACIGLYAANHDFWRALF
jgi:hypothetical protein